MVSLLRENTNRAACYVRSANVRAESANVENMTLECVISTEQPVAMFDYESWTVVDEILLASGRQVADSVPLLDAHDRTSLSKVWGHFENIRTEQGTENTLALALFDTDDPEAVKAFNKYKNRHATDFSVGYRVTSFAEVKPGESTQIEGRTFTAGARKLRIALGWIVQEASAVPIGADDKAKARAACVEVTEDEIRRLQSERASEGVAELREIQSPPSVVININGERSQKESAGVVPVESQVSEPANNGGQKREVDAMSGTESPATVQANDEAVRKGIEIEANRRSQIEAISDGINADVVRAALTDTKVSVDKARELFLADLQGQRKSKPVGTDAPAMIVGNRERDCNEVSLAMALAARMGASNLESVGHRVSYNPHTGQTKFERSDYRNKAKEDEFLRNLERADKYRGIHSVDLCREALRIAGIEAPLDRHELVTRAISTPALSAIYTNAGAAILVSEMEQYEDSTLGWTKEVDVKNFQENALVRVDGGRLKKRNKGQKAAESTIAATAEVVRAAHYANTLILDVIDIVDDQLGALKAAMDEYAIGVSDLRPSLVYGFLASNQSLRTDSTTLFHADHGNTATSTALTAANLQTVLAKLGAQKDAAGTVLNLTSCYIVTGTGYSFVADQLANSQEIRESAAANGTKNPFLKHGLATAADARLSAGFTDPATDTAVAGAPTLWYLAAKGGRHGVNVAFVEGMGRMPRLTTKVLNSEGSYGLAIDISHAIGCGVSGYQGLQKAVG